MNTRLFHRENGKELHLFFNGWSMDARVAETFPPQNADLLAVWDYTTLDAEALAPRLEGYHTIRLTAWSLGVWAAARVLGELGAVPDSALAINGTLRPLNETFGIAPDVFRGTIDNWPEERARERFLLRMTGSRAALATLPRSDRSWESQRDELAALEQFIAASPEPANLYNRAVIGLGDRIFPAAAQRAFWAQTGTPATELELAHYPFGQFTAFQEGSDLGRNR